MPNPVTPSEEPNQMEVVDNPINHQYEAVRGGQHRPVRRGGRPDSRIRLG